MRERRIKIKIICMVTSLYYLFVIDYANYC